MKKLVITTLAGCVAIAAASAANASITRLTTYNELYAALKNGHHVSAVADNSKCKVSFTGELSKVKRSQESDPDLNAVMGLSFNTDFFLVYRDAGDPRNYIITISAKTLANMGMGPRTRYKRIRVFDDNTVEVYAAFSNFNTGVNIGDSTSICALSNGNDQNGVSLFDYDA